MDCTVSDGETCNQSPLSADGLVSNSLDEKARVDVLDEKAAAKAARRAAREAKAAKKAAKKAGADPGQYTPTVDALSAGLAPVNKQALVEMFVLLAGPHGRFLDRQMMSAVFRAFNDKDSRARPLEVMPLSEWEGLCRVYKQVPTEGYGIPLPTLGEVYKLHLVNTATAPSALEFLQQERRIQDGAGGE